MAMLNNYHNLQCVYHYCGLPILNVISQSDSCHLRCVKYDELEHFSVENKVPQPNTDIDAYKYRFLTNIYPCHHFEKAYELYE